MTIFSVNFCSILRFFLSPSRMNEITFVVRTLNGSTPDKKSIVEKKEAHCHWPDSWPNCYDRNCWMLVVNLFPIAVEDNCCQWLFYRDNGSSLICQLSKKSRLKSKLKPNTLSSISRSLTGIQVTQISLSCEATFIWWSLSTHLLKTIKTSN